MPGLLSKITDKIKEQAPKAKKKPWELEMIIPFEKEPPRVVSKEDRLSLSCAQRQQTQTQRRTNLRRMLLIVAAVKSG